MNDKDLKIEQQKKIKDELVTHQVNYCLKNRQSRPHVKENILQPQTVIDRIEEDMNHCVVNDCTHGWGGDVNE